MANITINGEGLSEKEAVMIEELIYGALEYGVQSQGYLEDAENISKEEQISVLEGIQKQLQKVEK